MKHTERTLLNLLHKRYNQTNGGSRRYAIAEHPCEGGYYGRIADALVFDCWNSGKHAYHGFEIKTSRSDWLTELKQPDKAEAFKKYMDHWWLITPTKDIIKPEELPHDWGHLTIAGTTLRATKPAPKLTPQPIPRNTLTFIMRAIATTAARQAILNPQHYFTYWDPWYVQLQDLSFKINHPTHFQQPQPADQALSELGQLQ
jgi:hypothetical protein